MYRYMSYYSAVLHGRSVVSETVTARTFAGNALTVQQSVVTGNVTVQNLLSNGNVTAQNLLSNGRVILAADTTTGNTGVQITGPSYAGPLVEKRVAPADRYGVGTYGAADTVVYAASAATGARVRVGFAASDTIASFVDALTVTRNGALTTSGNVGINTLAPAAQLHVVGNVRVDGNVAATDAVVTSNLLVQNMLCNSSIIFPNPTGHTIQYANASYQGAMLEFRRASNQRCGIALYNNQQETCVYGNWGDANAKVRLGFAQTDTFTNFTSILTATRDGVRIDNVPGVGLNTLQVFGNVLVEASRLTMTTNLTTGNTGVQITGSNYAGPLVEKRVAPADRYGVGTYGATDTVLYAASTAAGARVRVGFASTDTAFVDALAVTRNGVQPTTGNVGINTLTPTAQLHVVGNVQVDGAIVASQDITAFSDRTLKSNLDTVGHALDKLGRLTGYTFERVDWPGRRYAGVIAQDVEAVLPEAVATATGGVLAVSHGSMSALFVEAIKELRNDLHALRNRVAVLEKTCA